MEVVMEVLTEKEIVWRSEGVQGRREVDAVGQEVEPEAGRAFPFCSGIQINLLLFGLERNILNQTTLGDA